MFEILLYAIGIMYTPGPVNLLSLGAGLNGSASRTLGFCAGVGLAMLILFALFGYTGAWLVVPEYQRVISLLGALYILWLAWKVGCSARRSASVDTPQAKQTDVGSTLTFKSGLIMQLCNPKAPLAVLPITTVQFPAAGIEGFGILLWSLLLGVLAFGAPGSYVLMGARMGRLIKSPVFFRALNALMALLLVYVALDITYSQLSML